MCFQHLTRDTAYIHRVINNDLFSFDGYRDYVIANLEHLERLDGVEIERSERIAAIQNTDGLERKIRMQQEDYMEEREREKEDSETP